jgi:hypothetical protein
MVNRWVWAAVLAILGLVLSVPAFAQPGTFKFDFGPGPVGEGMTRVLPEMIYSESAGFGFEPGGSITAVDRGGDDPVTGDFCTAKEPFFFSVAVPAEGDYRVTVTLGDRQAESVTTIKAELRRLMVQEVRTTPGKFEKVSFIVNTRTPKIVAVGDIKAGEVRLKAPSARLRSRRWMCPPSFSWAIRPFATSRRSLIPVGARCSLASSSRRSPSLITASRARATVRRWVAGGSTRLRA